MGQERAILAGGCFWGMEDLIRRLHGVQDTTVGYTGGTLRNPKYKDMKSPTNRHAEAIEVLYDPAQLSYRELLLFFFQIHNPTTPDRQGNDIGPSYRSAIFYGDDAQRETAEALVRELDASGKLPARIITEITPMLEFYPAEGYHQDYLERYPDGYSCHYIRPEWKL